MYACMFSTMQYSTIKYLIVHVCMYVQYNAVLDN